MKPILARLSTWRKTDEDEEFVDKAIDSLFKKLKTKQGAIEDLERAINNPGVPSKCVTIPRSLDGRLQVSHRKGLPHVIYCRIFRWPDLQSPHELRAIDACEFSFSSKQNEVCVNPYHYERVDMPVLPPVLVPRHVEYSAGHSLLYNPTAQTQSYTNSLYYNSQHSSYYSSSSTSTYYPQQQVQQPAFNNTARTMSPGLCYSPDVALKDTKESGYLNPQSYHYQSSSPATSLANEYPKANISHNNANRSNSSSSSFVSSPQLMDSPDGLGDDLDVNVNNSTSPPLHKTPAAPLSKVHSPVVETGEKPTSWCSIVYYELNQRIGEIFHATASSNGSGGGVFVDGYTDPRSQGGRKFSLGMFSNVNRTATIENCRKHIGRGVHVYTDNGDVYVECLSQSAIFIQSRNCNQEHGLHPATVCKLLPGYSLRIFQSRLFAEKLNESINQGYDAVYELANACVVKLSFVKGWGADYYRQEVSSCPCWIEIRLNEPFQWLDRVLKEMGSSSNPATSVS